MTVETDMYPSRVGATPMILERLDPTVYGEGAAPEGISQNTVEDYRNNGFTTLSNLFSDEEVRGLTQEFERLIQLPELKGDERIITEPGSGAVRSIFAVHRLSQMFLQLASDHRLLDLVRYLLDDDVYLHQSRINLKPGFAGKEFYWHSDFETWHVEDGLPRMRALSCSIALTPNNEFNGPLMLVPGSQEHFIACVGETPEENYKESLKKQDYGVPDQASLRQIVNERGIVAPKGAAGSAVFFDCNTMHGSNSNISPYPRSNVFFVFNAVSNRPETPFCGLQPRPSHIAEREDFTPLRRGRLKLGGAR